MLSLPHPFWITPNNVNLYLCTRKVVCPLPADVSDAYQNPLAEASAIKRRILTRISRTKVHLIQLTRHYTGERDNTLIVRPILWKKRYSRRQEK